MTPREPSPSRRPPLQRSGPVEPDTLAAAISALGVAPDRVLAHAWVDNGPGWIGLLLADATDVLDLRPDLAAIGQLKIGVIGAHTGTAAPADVEVRAFCPGFGVPEDPVTGSLNAGLAMWLTATGVLPPAYRARQGTALGRDGRVEVTTGDDGRIWVGGACVLVVDGTVELGA